MIGFDFRLVKYRIGASLFSSVVTTSASWLLNSSAEAAGAEKSDDLRRSSSITAVSILLQFRYENEPVAPWAVYSDLGDNEKMFGDESTFLYDSVEHNIWVVRGYDVKHVLITSWFFNMRSEI